MKIDGGSDYSKQMPKIESGKALSKSKTESKSPPGAMRFEIAQKGEMIDRIHDLATTKKFNFSTQEQEWLDNAMLSSNSMKGRNLQEFEDNTKDNYRKILKEQDYNENEINNKLSKVELMVKEVKAYSISIAKTSKMGGKPIGISGRILKLAEEKGFARHELNLLQNAMLKIHDTPLGIDPIELKKFEEMVSDSFGKLLVNDDYRSGKIKFLISELEGIFTNLNELSDQLSEKYGKGEEIPEYILKFDVEAPHTMTPSNYLDVRLSRKLMQTTQFVNQNGEKNVEIFIGPVNEMKEFYQLNGYREVGLMGVKSSNSFYYFENPENPSDSKLVITNVLNSSRLNHVLLQLKFSGVNNLEKSVKIRGTFQDSLHRTLETLDKELKFEHPPELFFIGNRTLILIGLAERLYPEEMNVPAEKKEEVAINLLKDHDLVTKDVGGCFKFSYVTAEFGGKKKGIIAMRMPNGSLSYEATRLVLENGAKNIVTVGAGGSMTKESDVGSFQIIRSCTSSQNEDAPIKLKEENFLNLEISDLQVLPDCKNITVDTPLVENKEWVKIRDEKNESSVDVETFHIMKAVSESVEKGGDIKVLPGLFISDVLGEHPLEQKIDIANAWKGMPNLLDSCFDHFDI